MTTKTLLTTLTLAWAGVALAQTPQWNCDKYPDYDPTPRFDMTAHRHMTKRMASNRAAGQTRPDHWNNGLMEAFPPVVNQSGGSCGSASRIYYMFAEEINAARGANGKLDENIYPTHFTWLLTWCPDQGKEVIAQHNGIPNSAVYGGYTFSDLFGYQDCDSQTGYDFGWMQGYDKWHHAMHNRITGSANFAIALDKEEGREMVKNYLWNHCGDNSFSTGGVVGVGVASGGDWKKISLPRNVSTINSGYYANKYFEVYWRTNPNKGVTEQGSSGSPLFNGRHLIIGTLTAGSSSCTYPGESDLYGRLAYHWNNNGATANDRKLQPWLDPDNTGATTLNSMRYDGSVITGIADQQLEETFTVAPNPVTSGTVTVNGDFLTENAVCNIYNTMGQLVMSKDVETSSTFTINVNALTNGVYFVEIRGSQRNYMSKMIISR